MKLCPRAPSTPWALILKVFAPPECHLPPLCFTKGLYPNLKLVSQCWDLFRLTTNVSYLPRIARTLQSLARVRLIRGDHITTGGHAAWSISCPCNTEVGSHKSRSDAQGLPTALMLNFPLIYISGATCMRLQILPCFKGKVHFLPGLFFVTCQQHMRMNEATGAIPFRSSHRMKR